MMGHNCSTFFANLDTNGAYSPLVWSFASTFALFACISGLWVWWRSPKRIQKYLRKDGLGLLELKELSHIRARDWIWSCMIALLLTALLSVIFYNTLYREVYQGLPWWVMLTNSFLSEDTFLGIYHPLPYGILGAVLLGIVTGRILGLAIGRKTGLKRVLITSRLRDPVKF